MNQPEMRIVADVLIAAINGKLLNVGSQDPNETARRLGEAMFAVFAALKAKENA